MEILIVLLNEALGLSIHQSEVDFLIPNLKEDLHLYVDPYLFYKSKNKEYNSVHGIIHQFFKRAVAFVKTGDLDKAQNMMSFPEVQNTMIGVSKGNHDGRGLGNSRSTLIYKEIVANRDIQDRGLQHLAEMQLLIMDVGFDMVSDMCTNIAKEWFVRYTQEQCRLHDIPLEKGVCLGHVYDWDENLWDDIHADLPVNPINGKPILLVPKSVVRRFEEIDFKDFWNTTYRYILRDIEVSRSLQSIGREPTISWKTINEKYGFSKAKVVEVLHEAPELMQAYFAKKDEIVSEIVTPVDLNTINGTDRAETPPDDFIAELKATASGDADAKKYEKLMLRILTRLFTPPLIDPREQVYSDDRREIKDITFYNAANQGFWKDIKDKHGSISVPFELKNMDDIGNNEIFQIAARLNDAQGAFGVLVARKKDSKDKQRAGRRLDNNRQFIVILTDDDIVQMLSDLKNGMNPTMRIQRLYRNLIEGA